MEVLSGSILLTVLAAAALFLIGASFAAYVLMD